MTVNEQLENLINAREGNPRRFAEKIGLPYTTLKSILARDIGLATSKNLIKICRPLNISLDALSEGRVEYINNARTELDAIMEVLPDEKQAEILHYAKYILENCNEV